MIQTRHGRLTQSLIVVCMLLAGAPAWAALSSLAGDWKTPGGSIVRVEPCASGICLTLVRVAPDVKVSTDTRNPDPALKSRPLCGLRIGDGFVSQADGSASGGHLYDPQSGKTYSGKMTMDGQGLKLRGYIGVSLFGRLKPGAGSSVTSISVKKNPRNHNGPQTRNTARRRLSAGAWLIT